MASTAPVAVRGWVVDRQFRWPILFLLCASFGFPVLPVGLVFDPAVREKLSPDAASGVFRMMWLPLILLAFSIVYRRRRLLLSMWPEMNRSLLLLYGWVFLTMVWAPDPGATLRQAISIFGAWLLAFSEVSASWTPERWVVAMRWTALVMMVLSAIAAIAVPAIGVQPEDQFELSGSWRGITYQKNGLGQLASFGLIFFVYGFLSGSTNRRFALLGAGLSFFMVLMSRSSTATLLALIAMLQMYLLIRPPIRLGATGGVIRYGVALAILVPLLLYMLLVGAVDPESIAQSFGGLFGKDATFSGRTYIWAELLQEIPKHLWFRDHPPARMERAERPQRLPRYDQRAGAGRLRPVHLLPGRAHPGDPAGRTVRPAEGGDAHEPDRLHHPRQSDRGRLVPPDHDHARGRDVFLGQRVAAAVRAAPADAQGFRCCQAA
jgi:hypothetical protein